MKNNQDTFPPLPQEILDEKFPGGFTLRDEANSIVNFCFRNTSIENLHAGKHSEILENTKYSRITDEEMKALMIEACKKVEFLLELRENEPENYKRFIQARGWMFCAGWDRK